VEKNVTLRIPEHLLSKAESLAAMTSQPVEEILVKALESALPDRTGNEPPVDQLSDYELLALTETRMEPEEDEQLSRLLQKRQTEPLPSDERAELTRLYQTYLLLWQRQSEALAEAVKRGLRGPVAAQRPHGDR
jgi:hypothetical protein